MIITRTPYRISFFGGGTDYYDYYKKYGGDILSTSIDHYNYISCRYLPPFHHEYKNRIAWRILEYPNRIEDIKHNAIRAALKVYKIKQGMEISNQCDLPARSGLGSSSSFCASLIKAIYTLKGKVISKDKLTEETIKLERQVLKESGGIQDQIACVYGGLNYIHINNNGSFYVEPIIMNEKRKKYFNDHLLLFFTGTTRNSSELAKKQVESIKHKIIVLNRMQQIVNEAKMILSSNTINLDEFGYLLNENWKLKCSLTDQITNPLINKIYDLAIKEGAIGGKILGAGGGGFILFYANPKKHVKIKRALKNLINVPFKFDEKGCQVILYSPKEYPMSIYKNLNYIHLNNNMQNL